MINIAFFQTRLELAMLGSASCREFGHSGMRETPAIDVKPSNPRFLAASRTSRPECRFRCHMNQFRTTLGRQHIHELTRVKVAAHRRFRKGSSNFPRSNEWIPSHQENQASYAGDCRDSLRHQSVYRQHRGNHGQETAPCEFDCNPGLSGTHTAPRSPSIILIVAE